MKITNRFSTLYVCVGNVHRNESIQYKALAKFFKWTTANCAAIKVKATAAIQCDAFVYRKCSLIVKMKERKSAFIEFHLALVLYSLALF